MNALGDAIAALPQPLPGGAQGSNEGFATKNFVNRNIIVQSHSSSDALRQQNEKYQVPGAAREGILKKENCRWIATEH